MLTEEEQIALLRRLASAIEEGRACKTCLRYLDKPTTEKDCPTCRAEDYAFGGIMWNPLLEPPLKLTPINRLPTTVAFDEEYQESTQNYRPRNS